MKNRWFKSLVGLVVAVFAGLSIGTMAFTRQTTSVVEDNRLAPLDWYFSHDHGIIDGDNNVVSAAANTAPLEWYFGHDHAIIDGDNNVFSAAANVAPLEWYFSHDHAIIDGDDNIVPTRLTNASAE